MKRKIHVDLIAPLGMVGITILSGALLMSVKVKADDSVIDNVSVTVPAACTMSGTGMNSHTAEIQNGIYQANIGTTTLHAFCNDANGFAIYAAGYTGNEIGGTNSNKLVGTAATNNATIVTGLATSTPTPDVSNWAMKLAIQSDSGNTTGTNAVTIDSDTEGSFASYHTVPNEYKKVAHKNTATDMSASTGGVKLTTTYAAYISKTQPADTYTGQVIYTLVHPGDVSGSAVRNAVTVEFDGNGFVFPNGATKNTVRYTKVYDQVYSYVSDAVGGVSKTSNIDSDGNQIGPVDTENAFSDSVTISGANRLKVILRFDVGPAGSNSSNSNAYVAVYDNNGSLDSSYYGNGTEIITAEGDTVNFSFSAWDGLAEGHNYGYFAEVYAAYDEEQPNTTGESLPANTYNIVPISGEYLETTEWYKEWRMDNGETFMEDRFCEADWCMADNTPRGNMLDYINMHYDEIKGTTLYLKSYNPVSFDEVYAAFNKLKLDGYYKIQDLNAEMCAEVSDFEIATVIDVRDNNLYSIGKYDNSCWIRENLKLDPTDSTTAANMSSANTNATDAAIYNYLHGGNPDGNSGWSTAVVSKSTNDSYTEPLFEVKEPDNQRLGGYYYNYCATTVGTICYGPNDYNGWTTQAPQDICPVNWRIIWHSGTIGSPFFPHPQSYSDRDNILGIQYSSDYYWTTRVNSSARMEIKRGQSSWYSYDFRVVDNSAFGNRHFKNFIRCVMSSNS